VSFKSPIIVTGAARSGTSLVTGIFAHCGAWVGETFDGTPDNPKGFMENITIRERVLKPLLAKAGADPKGQRPLPELKDLPDISVTGQILTAINRQGYPGGPWVFKGVKCCLTWPIWVRSFPEATWIIVRRDPEDILTSVLNASFMRAYRSREGWRKWYSVYDQRLCELEGSALNKYVVRPADIVRGDFGMIREAVRASGLAWDQKAVDKWVDPSLFGGSDGK